MANSNAAALIQSLPKKTILTQTWELGGHSFFRDLALPTLECFSGDDVSCTTAEEVIKSLSLKLMSYLRSDEILQNDSVQQFCQFMSSQIAAGP